MFFPHRIVNCIRPAHRHFCVWVLLLQLISVDLEAQVNAYAKVSAINGASLSLTNVNTSFGGFVAAQHVLIIQMQGATISGSSNNSSFGSLGSLNSAGLYELATVNTINPSTGLLTLTSPLINSYAVSGNVQVVSFPVLGNMGFHTSAAINALPWNGSIGGVVAFGVQGNLYVNHSISANSAGFRAGNKAGNDGSPCQGNVWVTSSGNAKYADKGEGIFISPFSLKSGKAKSINGGGGGIVHNGGGGGGGNFTSGGAGFYGFDGDGCSQVVNAGGQGGISISSGPTRVFAGGGGGGGQENNGHGTSGGNGGGLIFIRCDSIIVPMSGVTRNISADGASALNTTGHDGAGGGGAGGSIILDVKGVRVPVNSNLNISANGGNGGNVLHHDLHGSGGGGGQGTILINHPGPFAGTIVQTLNGTGGLANTSPTAPRAGSGTGANNVGVKWSSGSVLLLPVTLTEFTVEENPDGGAELRWVTITEKNNKVFEIMHTTDGITWRKIGEVPGSGNSNVERTYKYLHASPSKKAINYYKLLQKDNDGQVTFSDVVFLQLTEQFIEVKLYPNPAHNIIFCEASEDRILGEVKVTNSQGIQQAVPITQYHDFKFSADLSDLPPGLYVIHTENMQVRIIKQ